MSLMLDDWPPPPDPPPPRRVRRRRRIWPWLVGVTAGMAAWAGVLRPEEPRAYVLLGVALALGLLCVALLARTSMPGWLVGATLVPALVLCSSGATYLHALLGFEDSAGIHPINGYVLVFGGGWAVVALAVCATITLGRALAVGLPALRETHRSGDRHS